MDIELLNEYEQRMSKTRIEASKRGVGCLIIFGLAPRRVGDLMYLTGHQPMLPGHPRRFNFKGRGYSAIVLPIDKEPCLLTTTPFYEKELYIKDVKYGDDLFANIATEIKKRGLEKSDIGIVGMDILSVTLYRDLKKELYQARFFQCDDIVMNLRAQKSLYELNILRAGAGISDIVSEILRNYLRPGITELQVYELITSELAKRGVTNAFATCQSGNRSETAYELVPATDKVIESGDMIHMEINGKLNGYMIDICRSTVMGKIKQEQIRILNLVLHMFDEAVKHMKPGVTAESLERITGKIAIDEGFVSNHTNYYGGPATLLGHAIGLGVDEPPVLAEGDKTILVPGMVITLEPGLYNTGYGGCRIEDEVLITDNGYEILNKSERKWW